ncbi:MAG: TIR domain-containing protein [Rhodocyclaceae bacterium]|nr:TIR domain-containing protein [Rhodocyclaceae bacterium]
MSGLLSLVRRKVFVSYHRADEQEVQHFIKWFDHAADAFIARGIGSGMAGDVIDSKNSDYIMGRIRSLYLSDSTVTVVMIGNCTWSRKYVDWEVQASLRSGGLSPPNGLIGIRLPSYHGNAYPRRLNLNLLPEKRGLLAPTDCYARVYDMPRSVAEFRDYVEDAFRARTARRTLIQNPRSRMGRDLDCGHPWH